MGWKEVECCLPGFTKVRLMIASIFWKCIFRLRNRIIWTPWTGINRNEYMDILSTMEKNGVDLLGDYSWEATINIILAIPNLPGSQLILANPLN